MDQSSTISTPRLLTLIGVFVLSLAFLFMSWFVFKPIDGLTGFHHFVTPEMEAPWLFDVANPIGFTGIRLLLRESEAALMLMPLAILLALISLRQRAEQYRPVLLIVAGLLGLGSVSYFLFINPFSYRDWVMFFGDGFWSVVLMAIGLILLGITSLPALSSRWQSTVRATSGDVQRRGRALPLADLLAHLPWWLLVAALMGVVILWSITTSENYAIIFNRVKDGIVVTIYVTLIAYSLSLVMGLFIGLARVSTNRVVYQVSTFYVEIARGLPILVLLYYIAFVAAPALANLLNLGGLWMIDSNLFPAIGEGLAAFSIRDFDFTARAVMALTMGYSAFLSEVFRAGIESVEHGQMEAARSLGMSYWQAMRHVILPQAIRHVLPPLGNNFVAMLKDSSLVSVLGVRDITKLGEVYSTSTFRFFETYNIVAFLYLVMTIMLSMFVRYVERALDEGQSISLGALFRVFRSVGRLLRRANG